MAKSAWLWSKEIGKSHQIPSRTASFPGRDAVPPLGFPSVLRWVTNSSQPIGTLWLSSQLGRGEPDLLCSAVWSAPLRACFCIVFSPFIPSFILHPFILFFPHWLYGSQVHRKANTLQIKFLPDDSLGSNS